MNTTRTNSNVNVMKDYESMSYQDVLNEIDSLRSIAEAKRQEAMAEAIAQVMKNFGASKSDIINCMGGDVKVEPISTTTAQEETEIIPALPESTDKVSSLDELINDGRTVEVSIKKNKKTKKSVKKVKRENKVETVEPATGSVFDNPAFKAPYNPKAVECAAVLENKIEEPVSSLEELLSGNPEYKAYYTDKTPIKNSKKKIVPMDELLSGKPVNRIFNLGNTLPEGASFRQHTRICHADGICPTLTATGNTTSVYLG